MRTANGDIKPERSGVDVTTHEDASVVMCECGQTCQAPGPSAAKWESPDRQADVRLHRTVRGWRYSPS